MKKFFSAFLTAILLVFPISLSACSNDGEWKEIQSIYYRTDSGGNTVTSTYIFNWDEEEVSKEEYDSGPYYYEYPPNYNTIRIDRKTHLAELSNSVGGYYYSSSTNYADDYVTITGYRYIKHIVSSISIRYVKIRFLDDSAFELKYYENEDYVTIRVLPSSYVINYFTE